MDSSSPERDNDLALFESEEKYPGASGSGGMSSSREVSWKEMGMLQIQLPNVGSDDHSSMTSVEDACEGGKNEHHHITNVNDPAIADECSQEIFTGEDEDEETLRKMVLQTLQKKISERAKAEKLPGTMTAEEENSQNLVIAPKDKYVADDPVVSQAATTLKVVIHQKVDEVTVNEAIQKGSSDHCNVRKVVIEEQSKAENSKEVTIHEGLQDEDIGGEWMVLDEVLEEGSEGNGEDSEQCSTIGNIKSKTDLSKEDSSGVSHDSETNYDGNIMLEKTRAMFKEKACNQVINEGGKTIGKDKEVIHEDCLTVVCTSGLEGKQQVCLGISVAEEEEVQKKLVSILDGQKVCKGSMICREDRNEIIDDTRITMATPGLIPNDKCGETQRQYTSKTCENVKNLLPEGDDGSSGLSGQTVTCIPFSFKQLDTESSECNNEKEMKSGSLQHLSRLKNCKDEESASQKNNTVSVVRIEQHSHYDPSTENPEKFASRSCHKIGQEKAKSLGDDSKMDQSSVEVKDLCQNMKKPRQEPEKGCIDMHTPQQREVLIRPKEQDDTNLKDKGICAKRGRTDTNKTRMQASANDTINISDFKHPTGHSSSIKLGMCAGAVTAEDGGLKAPGRVINEEKSEKSVKTKRLLILKKIERDYSEKR